MSHSEHTDESSDSVMGRAVLRGVAIGLPTAIVALTFVVWAITDLDLGDSFATALLPGVLLGGFAGGFAGVAMSMD
jgi:hypothetical protein